MESESKRSPKEKLSKPYNYSKINLIFADWYSNFQHYSLKQLKMRISFLPLLVIVMIIGTSCQPKVNVEKEKEAIMAVIHEEAAGAIAQDKDRAFATHMQDSEETRLELGVYGYRIFQGWDEIEELIGDVVEDGSLSKAQNSKENVILKVTGNSAWLVCDNNWTWSNESGEDGFSNIQITFLEKVKGEWKISFSAYYNKPVPVPGVDEMFN